MRTPNRRTWNSIWQGLCLAGVLGAATTDARAALIYEDRFLVGGNAALGQYTAATLLPSQNPTLANANAAWYTASGSVSSDVNLRSSATGISFGSYQTYGGAAEAFRSSGTNTDPIVTARAASSNATTTMAAGEEFYFSALVDMRAGRQIGFGIDFEGRNNFGVGFNSGGSAGIFHNNLFLTASAVTNGGSPFAPGVYLIAGKVTPNNGLATAAETISLLLVASSAGSIPLPEPVALSTSAQDVWGNVNTADTLENYMLYNQKHGSTGISGRVDELRVGRTWGEITALPEPSAGMLVLLTGFAGLRRRRRH